MARSKGSANFAGSLEVLAGAPLDARTVVNVKADLTDFNSYTYVYVGMIVSVKSEGKAYILTAADFTDSANWSELGSGGSGKGGVVEGYFNPTDDLFYEESTYETAITGESGMLYVSLDTNRLYRFNGTIFVVVSDLDATVYQPAGSVLFANLPAASAGTLGFVYDIQDDFVTTSDFIEGAGKAYSAGTNVVVINHGTSSLPIYKYDVLSGRAVLPSGGTTGQALVKHSNTDGDVEWATVGGGGSYTAGDGIDITNNEISVKVDGETITVDELGVLHASGGGGGIAIGDVTGAAYTMYHETVSLTWTDPNDIEISGVPVAQWKGTKVVRKVGIAPADVTDGTLIANVTTRNQHSSNPLVDSTVEYGNTYYYRFFPYTRQNEVTAGTSLSLTPEKDQISNAPAVSGTYTYDGTEQSPTWINYDSTKMDISGDYAETNAGTYTVTFTAKHDYEFFIGGQTSSAVTATWTMDKAAGGAILSTDSVLLNQEHLTATVTLSNITGEIISVVSSDTTVAVATLSGSTITISLPQNGKDGFATIAISIAETANYYAGTATISVECDLIPSLENASWALISQFSSEGKAESAWSVGDRKTILVQGTCGTVTLNDNLDVFIMEFNHNSLLEGTGITFGCFKQGNTSSKDKAVTDSKYNSDGGKTGTKYLQMNHWQYVNYGGWSGCDCRYDILGSTDTPPSEYGTGPAVGRVGYDASSSAATTPVSNTLMSCLPADLRAVMKPISKYTDNVGGGTANTLTESVDYLPLMSASEVYGVSQTQAYDESAYQTQYEYYSNGNSGWHYKINSSDTAYIFLRSPAKEVRSFCRGSSGTSKESATYSLGISPVFLV